MLKKCAVLPLVAAVFVVAGCDYFNVPLKPFMDRNAAKVTLASVNFGSAAGGSRWHTYDAGADYEVPVTFNNPQRFNINVAIKSVSVNGYPPPQLPA